MPDWDRIFEERGRVFTTPHPDIQRIMRLFHERCVSRVLDLGCGTGRHIVALAREGFEIYGFDSSPHALQIARAWLSEEELTAELIEHRMERPFPYEDDFFDAVISIQVIHHNMMKDILTTVSEMERILHPSGIIFLTVPLLRAGPVEQKHDWKLLMVEDGTFIPQTGPESGIPHHYFSPEEIPVVFKAFRLEEIYVDATDHRCIIGVKR